LGVVAVFKYVKICDVIPLKFCSDDISYGGVNPANPLNVYFNLIDEYTRLQSPFKFITEPLIPDPVPTLIVANSQYLFDALVFISFIIKVEHPPDVTESAFVTFYFNFFGRI
jgi:hypothetical protein